MAKVWLITGGSRGLGHARVAWIIMMSVAAMLATAAIAAPARAQTVPTATATERTNKEAVAQAYAAWAAGGTRFFDILDDRIVWTILGTGPHARTYRGKAAFVEGAVNRSRRGCPSRFGRPSAQSTPTATT